MLIKRYSNFFPPFPLFAKKRFHPFDSESWATLHIVRSLMTSQKADFVKFLKDLRYFLL